jgi:hypothetical protein
MTKATDFRPNVMIVAQSGRLQYEAVLFAASLARADPQVPLWVAEPQPGPLWPDGDPRMDDPEARAAIIAAGGRIVPFENRLFGAGYPHGNKIEALSILPEGAPFLFFDTDTLIRAPLGLARTVFDRPSASMRRSATWPIPQPGGPEIGAIWASLYARFGLDIGPTLEPAHPPDHWERYLYFNAGWFLGPCPRAFGDRFAGFAAAIRDDPPPELAGQKLWPWLDQIALPLVVAALGGGRPGAELAGLDGATSCHYRTLPLLHAREEDAVVALFGDLCAMPEVAGAIGGWAAAQRILGGDGTRIRAMFDRAALPADEGVIRRALRAAGLWFR